MAAAKKNHYETLGVSRDAKPDEIKRARRKRAREVHPDLNPETSEEEIKEINHAADVLLDPERRLLYDATGRESEKSVDEEVRNLILTFFNDALQKNMPNCLDHCRFLLKRQAEQIVSNRSQATEARERMVRKRDKIKVKGDGVNLFHQLIDTNITQLAGNIAQLDRAERVTEVAKELMDEYESSEEKVERVDFGIALSFFGTASTSGTGTNQKKRKTK